jgi:RIO-like serine/threonine protein kinase
MELSRRVHECVVWVQGGKVWKKQPKHFTDNEYHWLCAMEDSGYVPIDVVLEDLDTLSMEFVNTSPVTNANVFMSHYFRILEALAYCGVRHGDLTEYAVLARDNKPVIIDWAEARIKTSPIVSKRPEGDTYWLRRTMRQLANLSQDG